MNSISIVIPAFNEEMRLLNTLSAVADYSQEQSYATEILVVDDGSTDGTAELVRRYATRCPTVRLIQNGRNRGKGYSVRCGVQKSTGEIIFLMDADLPRTHPTVAEPYRRTLPRSGYCHWVTRS